MNSSGPTQQDPDIGAEILNYCTAEAPIVVLVLDREGNIVDANQYARTLLGISEQSLKLSDVLMFAGEAFQFEQAIEESRSSRERVLLNLITQRGLPQSFYFRFSEHGDSLLAIGHVDADEAELLRKNFVELNNSLSNTNRELQKSKAELSKLNELKNHFLGMAAHDLRSPIGSIGHLCDFVLESADSTLTRESREFISMIKSSSAFTLALLDELLDIARIEAGRLDLNLQQCDLRKLVEENLQIHRIAARTRNIEVAARSYETLPPVVLDRNKIIQVLNNLIGNAVKFSKQNGKVTVALMQAHNHVVVSVSDTGTGIAAHELEQVFEPFGKAGKTSPAGEKSTGLGLSIAKRIVVAHMGRIWVESEPGCGSTFRFSLPVAGPFGEEEQASAVPPDTGTR